MLGSFFSNVRFLSNSGSGKIQYLLAQHVCIAMFIVYIQSIILPALSYFDVQVISDQDNAIKNLKIKQQLDFGTQFTICNSILNCILEHSLQFKIVYA